MILAAFECLRRLHLQQNVPKNWELKIYLQNYSWQNITLQTNTKLRKLKQILTKLGPYVLEYSATPLTIQTSISVVVTGLVQKFSVFMKLRHRFRVHFLKATNSAGPPIAIYLYGVDLKSQLTRCIRQVILLPMIVYDSHGTYNECRTTHMR